MGEKKQKQPHKDGHFDKRDQLREEWKHDKNDPATENIPYEQRKAAERESRQKDSR